MDRAEGVNYLSMMTAMSKNTTLIVSTTHGATLLDEVWTHCDADGEGDTEPAVGSTVDTLSNASPPAVLLIISKLFSSQ
jgi:hypothetical protein